MPFPMKIQPIDSPQAYREQSKPPVLKSRLKRLFDRPFNSVLKIASDKPPTTVSSDVKDVASTAEFEPSSVCLDKMVQNFIEENAYEKPPAATSAAQKCGRHRCNCFNGNSNDSSDDEFDLWFGDSVVSSNSSFGDSFDTLKSLIPCATTVERNLLADTSKIVEKNKTCKKKDDLRKIVTDGLLALGFNASICKSKWEKSSSIPAGKYEYIDVIMEGERVLIDVDFRSEFEIARSTGSYKAILQSLPFTFVGKSDRLLQIIAIVSEAARQSLKKKGMHIAPWRKTEYVKAKWLSPFVRITAAIPPSPATPQDDGGGGEVEAEIEAEKVDSEDVEADEGSECGELELIFGEKTASSDEPKSILSSPARVSGGEANGSTPVMVPWQPPPVVRLRSCEPVVRLRSCERGNRAVVTGLASLLKEKP